MLLSTQLDMASLEWWQIDITWYVIRFLEEVGFATDVKLPTQAQKKRKVLAKKLIVEDEVSLTNLWS